MPPSKKAPLSVVGPDDLAPAPVAKPEPKTIKDAADHSERALLVALRSKIAADIDKGVPPHTLAPLARQLRDLDKEIREIDARAKEEAEEGGTVPDEAFDAQAL